MARILGIDLGTTNSLCAVFEHGEPRLILNAHGSYLTPSVVGVLPDGRILVGDAARELGVTEPDRVAAWFKRWMGTDRILEVGGQKFSPQELSSLVLRSLREDARADLGEEITEAVVTVPAYFNDHQREATRLAGELAGLQVRRIVNEPTAAALTYGLVDRDTDKRLVVFDLGGGTLDVTVMDVFEGMLEIKATAGENHLGGEDFTDRMVEMVLRRHDLTTETSELHTPLLVSRLRRECERAKRELGHASEARVVMPHQDGALDDDCPVETITEAQYTEHTADLMRRVRRPLERALSDAECADEDIDEVILVGGATRMPMVARAVAEHVGREPLAKLDPDTVVALGAAVQAALLAEDSAVEDVMMTDVCPFTMGVEVCKHVGNQIKDGYYLPLIHRNTTIPISHEEIVSTLTDNQRKVDVRVFQGEARLVNENLLLGDLEVTGIPPGPAGTPIAIRFTYDVNGLLEVEARIEGTGEKFSTVFKHNVKNLAPAEIERAVAAMAKLKFYPREDLGNQKLLRFAAAAVGQVSQWARQGLEDAVDAYESALHDNDREVFDAARGQLLLQLSAVDCPYEEPGA